MLLPWKMASHAHYCTVDVLRHPTPMSGEFICRHTLRTVGYYLLRRMPRAFSDFPADFRLSQSLKLTDANVKYRNGGLRHTTGRVTQEI